MFCFILVDFYEEKVLLLSKCVYIEKLICGQLNETCGDARQINTIVVESALNLYFCNYRENKQIIRNM